MVLYVIIILVVVVIGVFIWAHYQVEKDEQKLLQEDPGALYPFFGVFTERHKYTTSSFTKDVILSNTDTGKIYIGGVIYDMLDIANCTPFVRFIQNYRTCLSGTDQYLIQ